MERSLDTYGNKKSKGGSTPSSAHRGGSPTVASTTPTTLLKGVRDPGRSYEDLLADSPPTTQLQPTNLHTPPPQTQIQTKQQQQQQQPWSQLMRRLLAEALSHQSPSPGEDSPLASYASPPADKAIAAQLRRAHGGLLLSAVVRPLSAAEMARGAREVLVVAPDGHTLLVVRPDVFQGAAAEHVAAAAAAYGQAGWATRYKFHLCLKGTPPTAPPASLGATAADLDAATSKTQVAITALASSLAEAVLGGRSSACFVYGAAGSGRSACFLESTVGAADGLAVAGFREVGT